MKKLFITLIGALAVGAALPALASPDWQLIEHARKARQTAQFERRGETVEISGRAVKCPQEALVLPLDDGPRAQTTPYENQVHKERYEALVKACKEASK